MRILASLGMAACLFASPALAGPAGSGLAFTEEVAKKRLEKESSARPQAAADCVKAKTATSDKSETSEKSTSCQPS